MSLQPAPSEQQQQQQDAYTFLDGVLSESMALAEIRELARSCGSLEVYRQAMLHAMIVEASVGILLSSPALLSPPPSSFEPHTHTHTHMIPCLPLSPACSHHRFQFLFFFILPALPDLPRTPLPVCKPSQKPLPASALCLWQRRASQAAVCKPALFADADGENTSWTRARLLEAGELAR